MESTLQKFEVSDAIEYGWRQTKVYFWSLLPPMAILIGAGIISFILEDAISDSPRLALLVSILSQLVQAFLGIGWTIIILKILDNKDIGLMDMFSGGQYFISYLVASIILMIVVIIGLIFFVVPGIYLAIRLGMYSYLIIDKDMGPIDALKESWHITRDHSGRLFLMYLGFILICIVGLVVILVGIIPAIMLCSLASIYAYHILSGRDSGEEKMDIV